MKARVPIRRFLELGLSPDGRSFSIVAEMHDGTKASFEISVRNADWLAQHILGFSREALKRQSAAGSLEYVANGADALLVEDHRVAARNDEPFVMPVAAGSLSEDEKSAARVTMRVLDVDGREVHSAMKGDVK